MYNKFESSYLTFKKMVIFLYSTIFLVYYNVFNKHFTKLDITDARFAHAI